MSYDGEIDEKDWCKEHACLKWQCRHYSHPAGERIVGTFEERHDAIDAIQNQAPVGWNETPYSHPLKDKNLCGWCHQTITIQIFMGSGHCCEDHRKLLAGETGVANPNPKG